METKPDLIAMLLHDLPTYISYDDQDFNLILFPDGTDDFRLCYALTWKDETWYHPILKGNKTFLYLVENIQSEQDLREAIEETRQWLLIHKIYPNEATPSEQA